MIQILPASDRMKIHAVMSMAENEGRAQRAQAEATLRSFESDGWWWSNESDDLLCRKNDESASQMKDASFSIAPQDCVSAFDQTLPEAEQAAIIDDRETSRVKRTRRH